MEDDESLYEDPELYEEFNRTLARIAQISREIKELGLVDTESLAFSRSLLTQSLRLQMGIFSRIPVTFFDPHASQDWVCYPPFSVSDFC